MSFSTTAGCSIIPTLSRVVLCMAFVAAGWNKCFKDATFTAEQAATLDSLGASVRPAGVTVGTDNGLTVVLASWQDDQEGEQDTGDAGEVTGDESSDDAQVPPSEDTSGDIDSLQPDSGALDEYRAKAVHKITLLVNDAGWPQPRLMAWVAGVTELLGGALLLIGLFSRIWGLGLAIAMGVAFYLTSFDNVTSLAAFDLSRPENYEAFNTLFSQLGLGVLALGVFLTGPGPLSLDRRLFGRSEEPASGTVILDDD